MHHLLLAALLCSPVAAERDPAQETSLAGDPSDWPPIFADLRGDFAEPNLAFLEGVGCLLRFEDRVVGLIDANSFVFEDQEGGYAYDSPWLELGEGRATWSAIHFEPSAPEGRAWTSTSFAAFPAPESCDQFVLAFEEPTGPAPVPVLDVVAGIPEPGTPVWIVGRDYIEVSDRVVARGTVRAGGPPDGEWSGWFIDLDEPLQAVDYYLPLVYGLVLDDQGRALGALGDISPVELASDANSALVLDEDLAYRRLVAEPLDRLLSAPPPWTPTVERSLGGYVYAIDGAPGAGEALVTGAESLWLETASWAGPAAPSDLPPAYLGAVHPDGERLVLWSDDGLQQVWLEGGRSRLVELPESTYDLGDLRCSPNGSRAYALDVDGPLIACDLEASAADRIYDEVLYASFDLCRGGRLIAAGGMFGELHVLLDKAAAPVRRFQVHEDAQLWPLAAHPQRAVAACNLTELSTVVVHDLNTGELLCELPPFEGSVCSLAWLPDGRHLAVGVGVETDYEWEGESYTETSDCRVELWDTGLGVEVAPSLVQRTLQFGDLPWELDVLEDGRLIVGTRDGRLVDLGVR